MLIKLLWNSTETGESRKKRREIATVLFLRVDSFLVPVTAGIFLLFSLLLLNSWVSTHKKKFMGFHKSQKRIKMDFLQVFRGGLFYFRFMGQVWSENFLKKLLAPCQFTNISTKVPNIFTPNKFGMELAQLKHTFLQQWPIFAQKNFKCIS